MFDHVEFVPEHLTRARRGDDGVPCPLCGVMLYDADTAPCDLEHGTCPIATAA